MDTNVGILSSLGLVLQHKRTVALMHTQVLKSIPTVKIITEGSLNCQCTLSTF